STRFPYTTLFRSLEEKELVLLLRRGKAQDKTIVIAVCCDMELVDIGRILKSSGTEGVDDDVVKRKPLRKILKRGNKREVYLLLGFYMKKLSAPGDIPFIIVFVQCAFHCFANV